MVKIATEGAGVFRVRGRRRAAVTSNVKEETDVVPTFQDKLVDFPGHNNGMIRACGVIIVTGRRTVSPVPTSES